MILPPRVSVLGVEISALNLESASSYLSCAAESAGHIGFVTVTGVHGVMESQDAPDLLEIHNRSFLSTPDGMPMVWVGRHSGYSEMNRVYGPELFLKVLDESVAKGYRHFFFGGAEGVAQELQEKMTARFPGLAVCGTMTPPFRPLNSQEEESLINELIESKPHFVWVGLSTPKQERFMDGIIGRHRERLSHPDQGMTFLGVGAAFDFHTHRVDQAPRWIQRSGFEWLFRLMKDPKRLWRRYAKNNPRFIIRIIRQIMRDEP